jgi:hypothetical protein
MRRIFFYALVVVVLIFLWEKVKRVSFFKGGKLETTHHTVLKEISELGKLELVKYAYRDVVEQKLVRDFLPDPKALLIIEGEAVGCIDLRKVQLDDIDFQGDTLLVHLPKPEICYHKIDHQKSRVYHTEYAFMNEGLLLEEAYKRAEVQILNAAVASDIFEQTKKNAETVLKPILEKTSSKKVLFKYPLEGELKRLK